MKSIQRIVSAGLLTWWYIVPSVVLAQYGENLNVGGLSNRALVPFVVSLINTVLGFLSLVLLIIVLVGGFKILTAGGDPKTVQGGRKAVVSAVVGLLVIFLSWSIVNFVFGVLKSA